MGVWLLSSLSVAFCCDRTWVVLPLLKRNYRNTQQIVQTCSQILEGAEAGDFECIHQQPSPHLGDRPIVLLTEKSQLPLQAIHQAFIAAAKKFRLPLYGGAVLCPGSKMGQEIAQQLKHIGVKAKFFSSNNTFAK